MLNVKSLKAANRPPAWRETTVWGRRVRVRWWHDAVAGLMLILLMLTVATVVMAL